MSYKSTKTAHGPQLERQQEKLRIAREALARVEAKYASKRTMKHRLARPSGVRRTHAEQ